MTEDTTQNNGKQLGGVTGKGFRPGDPRINRAGRPRSFDSLRKLMQVVANEPALDEHGNPIIIGADEHGDGGHVATNAEMFIRAWMKDRKGRRDFAAYAWGKPPDKLEIGGPDGDVLTLRIVHDDNARIQDTSTEEIPSETDGSHPKSGQA